jgi:hypothetical protein
MAVSTIRGNDSRLSTALIYVLGVIGVALTVFFGGELIRNLTGIGTKSGLDVDVTYGKAQVLVNDQVMGETPLELTNIKPGNNTIVVRNDSRQYQTDIKFLPSKKDVVYTVGIERDLGTSDLFSSGWELWFDKEGSEDTIKVVSEPSGASVFIDDSEVGKTPFSSSAITNGEYDLRLVYEGYESRAVRINIQKGYTLNVSMKLFPYPVPPVVNMFEGSQNLYNITLNNASVTSDTQAWVKGIIYWNTTRGINVDGVGSNKGNVFDYFIDYKGGIFDANGNPASKQEDLEKLKDLKRGAYLGDKSSGDGLTEEAKKALETLSSIGVETISSATAKIKPTPLGWLRVRETPSLTGAEITRVNTGESFSVLEDQGEWVKIRVSETIEGWVSSTYVEVSE